MTGPEEWGPCLEDLPDSLRQALGSIRAIAFDFDGVMTDNRVTVSQDGTESVTCSRFDGFGIERLRDLGLPACIVSTETNKVVAARAAKLKLPCQQDIRDKVLALETFCAGQGFTLAEIAFVGNDINDAKALRAVGLPIVVADCHPSVRHLGAYVTTRKGGHGAVREVCDLVAAAKAPSAPQSREQEHV